MPELPTNPETKTDKTNSESVYVNGVATPFLPSATLNKPEVVKPKVFNTAMIISFSAFTIGLIICGLTFLYGINTDGDQGVGAGWLLVWFVVMFQVPVTIATVCIFIQSVFRKIAPKKS